MLENTCEFRRKIFRTAGRDAEEGNHPRSLIVKTEETVVTEEALDNLKSKEAEQRMVKASVLQAVFSVHHA